MLRRSGGREACDPTSIVFECHQGRDDIRDTRDRQVRGRAGGGPSRDRRDSGIASLWHDDGTGAGALGVAQDSA